MARRKTHPGTIDKRGDAWRLRIGVGGERYTFTFHDMTREEVEEIATEKKKELEEDLRRGKLVRSGARKFSDLRKRFDRLHVASLKGRSPESYRESLNPLKTFFETELGDPSLHRITTGDFEEYMSWRRVHGPSGKNRKNPLSDRTIEKDRAIAHKMFRKAVDWGWLGSNPVARTEAPKVDNFNPVILTDDQYDTLLEKSLEYDRMTYTFVMVLGEAGLRYSEALHLRFEDVDFETGFLWVDSGRHDRRTKSGEGRRVVMTARLRGAMRDHFAAYRFAQYDGQRSPWVFHNVRNYGKAKKGKRRKDFRRGFNEACEAANLPEGLRIHDLRHRRATTWLQGGGNLVTVKNALGHSAVATTMRYVHLVDEDQKNLPGVAAEPKKEEGTREGLGA